MSTLGESASNGIAQAFVDKLCKLPEGAVAQHKIKLRDPILRMTGIVLGEALGITGRVPVRPSTLRFSKGIVEFDVSRGEAIKTAVLDFASKSVANAGERPSSQVLVGMCVEKIDGLEFKKLPKAKAESIIFEIAPFLESASVILPQNS